MKNMLLLLSLLLSLHLFADDTVLLRFGAISDNHFDRKRPEMAERTRKAFELFKKHKVDFFVDCGDVVDTYQPCSSCGGRFIWKCLPMKKVVPTFL